MNLKLDYFKPEAMVLIRICCGYAYYMIGYWDSRRFPNWLFSNFR
jgi:hypothetical protein